MRWRGTIRAPDVAPSIATLPCVSRTAPLVGACAAALALAGAGCGSVAPDESAHAPLTVTRPKPTATKPAPAPRPATTAAEPAPAQQAASPDSVDGGAPRPPIVQRPVPFGEKRKREMAAYSERHYGISEYRLSDPRVIVEHYTVTPDFQSTYNVFGPDVPDAGLHELPALCAHFVVDKDGTIYQLVPLSLMCRHTVGLNWTAIGIEHVGNSDQDILGNPAQLDASLALTHWLQCRFSIQLPDVIGHNESLKSQYHHENVASLRSQTHGDWPTADMNIYRAKLDAMGSCGSGGPTGDPIPATGGGSGSGTGD